MSIPLQFCLVTSFCYKLWKYLARLSPNRASEGKVSPSHTSQNWSWGDIKITMLNRQILTKSGRKVKEWQTEIILSATVILISFLSFQAGKFYYLGQSANPLVVRSANLNEVFIREEGSVKPSSAPPTSAQTNAINLPVVASKNSDKYHFLWCSGAAKISAKNKITFASEAEASAAGYTLAANCQKN